MQLLLTLYKVVKWDHYLFTDILLEFLLFLIIEFKLFPESLTGMDRTLGQRENLRWRKDLTQWRQTNDRQDK